MNTYSHVNQVTDLLTSAGFRLHSPPFVVSGFSFDLDALLSKEAQSSDLVAVISLTRCSKSKAKRSIEGLSRALDFSGSRRSLTAVLVGESLEKEFLNSISSLCRALYVEQVAPERPQYQVEDALAVLLPLNLPSHLAQSHDPLSKIGPQSQGPANAEFVKELLDASLHSGNLVTEQIRFQIAKVIGSIPSRDL